MRYLQSMTALLLVLGLSACGGEEETTATGDGATAQSQVSDTTAIADRDPLTGESRSQRLKKNESDEVESLPESDEPSPGLQMTLDGSSVEAFEKSMTVLKKNLKASEYNRLKTAVQYLQLYDFRNRGKAKLYASLDDMTPAQVEARAKEIMNR